MEKMYALKRNGQQIEVRLYRAMRNKSYDQKTRLKHHFQFARDYSFFVFERYVRMYGYLDTKRQFDFVKGIIIRWQRTDYRAHVHIYNPPKLTCIKVLGDYCPIGHAGYACDHYYIIDKCRFCGSEKEIIKGHVIKHNKRHPKLICDTFHYERGSSRCTNVHCREVSQFMRGHHPLVKPATAEGVLQKRPVSKINGVNEHDYAIGSAALLDFEARYIEKIMQ